MTLPDENYAVLLIDHTQLTREQWLDIKNGAGVITCIPYNEADLFLELPTKLNDAFLNNEQFKQELRNDEMRAEAEEIARDEEAELEALTEQETV